MTNRHEPPEPRSGEVSAKREHQVKSERERQVKSECERRSSLVPSTQHLFKFQKSYSGGSKEAAE